MVCMADSLVYKWRELAARVPLQWITKVTGPEFNRSLGLAYMNLMARSDKVHVCEAWAYTLGKLQNEKEVL